jgi:hypothetical protein
MWPWDENTPISLCISPFAPANIGTTLKKKKKKSMYHTQEGASTAASSLHLTAVVTTHTRSEKLLANVFSTVAQKTLQNDGINEIAVPYTTGKCAPP